MVPTHTIVEFQEDHCRIYAWQSVRGVHTLTHVLRVPFEKDLDDSGQQVASPRSIQANAAAIRNALRAADLRVRAALGVIPKQWVTLRVVTLPSTNRQELAAMARFEAERHIPFNVERHIIDFDSLGIEGIQGAQVIVAALDAPPAEEATQALEAAGIFLSALEVSTLPLANALLHTGEWDPEALPTVAHLDIGSCATDITILHDGVPIFARSVALGTDQLLADAPAGAPHGDLHPAHAQAIDLLGQGDGAATPEPSARSAAERPTEGADPSEFAPPLSSPGPLSASEDGPRAEGHPPAATVDSWARRLIQEIRRTHEFARREFECEPTSRVFLTGSGAQLGNLGTMIESALGIPTVELSPFSDTILLQIEHDDPGLARSAYALAVGGLLREIKEEVPRLNLLPASYINKHASSRRRQSLVTLVSLALILLVCAGIYVAQLIGRRERLLDFYRSEIEATQERAQEIRYRQAVVRILRQGSSRRVSALAILNTISSWDVLFNEKKMRVSLIEFQYQADRSVRMTGQALDYPDLNDFVLKLEETDHFSSVRIEKRPKERLTYGRKQEIVAFAVNGYLPRPKDTSRK